MNKNEQIITSVDHALCSNEYLKIIIPLLFKSKSLIESPLKQGTNKSPLNSVSFDLGLEYWPAIRPILNIGVLALIDSINAKI